ncbi:MAG: hypothetical protein V1787_03010 [Candidatus Micrarchaeota archaeon]
MAEAKRQYADLSHAMAYLQRRVKEARELGLKDNALYRVKHVGPAHGPMASRELVVSFHRDSRDRHFESFKQQLTKMILHYGFVDEHGITPELAGRIEIEDIPHSQSSHRQEKNAHPRILTLRLPLPGPKEGERARTPRARA